MISQTETVLTGTWNVLGGKVTADEVCERITRLVSSYLEEIARDPTGWDALYRDPRDGRLWELIYPQSEAHGGGPPQLRVIDEIHAQEKYGWNARSRGTAD